MRALWHAVRIVMIAAALTAVTLTVVGVGIPSPATADSGNLQATTAVNIRTGPSTSKSRLGVLYPGDRVKRIGPTKNGWAKISYRGKTGYVAARYLTRVKGTTSYGLATATTAVNIRARASRSSRILGVLRKGQSLTQAAPSRSGWTKVWFNNAPAYLSSRYLTGATKGNAGNGTAVYASAWLNLRTGPGLEYRRSTTVAPRTKLITRGTPKNGYAPVTYRGTPLWAATRYLADSPASAKGSLPKAAVRLRATADLLVRPIPTANTSPYADIPRGTIMYATGVVSGPRSQIVWRGRVAWVTTKYTRKLSSKPAPKAPPVPKTIGSRYAGAYLDLRQSPKPNARVSGVLPRGKRVRITGRVTNGRAQIVYRGAVYWVTAKYLGTARPGPIKMSSSQRKFIKKIAPLAKATQRKYRVPASVTIAQAIIESGWGRSRLTREGNAYFGIKCSKADRSPYPNGCYNGRTTEYDEQGNPIRIVDGFRTYPSLGDSVHDHGYFLTHNRRYRPAFKHTRNSDRFAREIHKAGYATDPAYARILIGAMQRYGLYDYDAP